VTAPGTKAARARPPRDPVEALGLPPPAAERVQALLAAAGVRENPHLALSLLVECLGWMISRLASNGARQVIARGLSGAVLQRARLHDDAEGQG
jgi:hypothetical protein